MPTSFRPRLEALDARELPSVTPFTFALSNGTLVTGSFDYADTAVDAAQATQQIAITDVTVAVNGQAASLIQELFAPTATFELGQLQNVVFAYDLGGVDLTSVAVASGLLVAIDAAGGVTSSALPVVTTATIPPTNPIPPPGPGDVQIDWSAMVASYTAMYNRLAGLQARLVQAMQEYDSLEGFYKDLRVKQIVATDPDQKEAWRLFADAYYDKLAELSRQIRDLELESQQLYIDAAAEASFLWPLLPEQLRAFFLPEPPPLIRVPAYYYEPLGGQAPGELT